MLPAACFPILLFLAYHLVGFSETLPDDTEQEKVVETTGINTDLPGVNVDKDGIKSKFQSMLADYGKRADRTAVSSIEQEEKTEVSIQSAYSDDEKRRVDSINAIKQAELEQLRRQARELRSEGEADGEMRVNVDDARIQDSPEMDRMVKQMQLIQRIADGERILTDEEKAEEKRRLELAAARQAVLDSIAQADRPLAVNKADGSNEQYFNSVSDGNDRPDLIKARIDELVKVKDGSRIRIRLSEDVEIDGEVLPKGSCLYALVTGFSSQRVKAKVSTVMVGGRIRKIDLNVYDLDCIEGFFVPQNSFREFAKEVGGNAANMNVNMNSSGEQNLQSIAMQSLQQAFQTTTAAISKQIRQNRAKIKYNTEVYLVNSNDIQ